MHVHVHAWNIPGNHTFASVKGPEEYNFLKASFAPAWKQLGDLIRDPYVYVEGNKIHLNIIFGSDYKVHFRKVSVYIPNYPVYYMQSWLA